MASLGASLGAWWVTPGAATKGVTPLFFPKKTWRPFLLITVTITIAFYCFHSGVTPSRVSPHTFLPVRPRFFTILCKFAQKNYFPSGVTPLEGVTRGGPPPPSSDATGPSCADVPLRNYSRAHLVYRVWRKSPWCQINTLICSNNYFRLLNRLYSYVKVSKRRSFVDESRSRTMPNPT